MTTFSQNTIQAPSPHTVMYSNVADEPKDIKISIADLTTLQDENNKKRNNFLVFIAVISDKALESFQPAQISSRDIIENLSVNGLRVFRAFDIPQGMKKIYTASWPCPIGSNIVVGQAVLINYAEQEYTIRLLRSYHHDNLNVTHLTAQITGLENDRSLSGFKAHQNPDDAKDEERKHSYLFDQAIRNLEIYRP